MLCVLYAQVTRPTYLPTYLPNLPTRIVQYTLFIRGIYVLYVKHRRRNGNTEGEEEREREREREKSNINFYCLMSCRFIFVFSRMRDFSAKYRYIEQKPRVYMR